MFKTKYLKQLQDVQARITKCKALIAELSPPQPDSFDISKSLYHWLSSLFYRYDQGVDLLYDAKYIEYDGPACDYLHKLGEYFMNTADYYNAKMKYDAELISLQQEEYRLKQKLGIN